MAIIEQRRFFSNRAVCQAPQTKLHASTDTSPRTEKITQKKKEKNAHNRRIAGLGKRFADEKMDRWILHRALKK